MTRVTATKIRDYMAGLAFANEYEIEELRSTSVETKLRQIWTLMGAAALFENSAQREAGVREARDRWARLYRALRA